MMLSDVEEKITTVDIDALTKQEQLKVYIKHLIQFLLDPKKEPFADIHERRPCHSYISDSATSNLM
jgi:hypothetical protein